MTMTLARPHSAEGKAKEKLGGKTPNSFFFSRSVDASILHMFCMRISPNKHGNFYKYYNISTSFVPEVGNFLKQIFGIFTKRTWANFIRQPFACFLLFSSFFFCPFSSVFFLGAHAKQQHRQRASRKVVILI